jgi:23S rRNA (cytidine2498-2'-O)-methyltransferase
MHSFLADPDGEPLLIEELRRVCSGGRHEAIGPGLVSSNIPLQAEPLPTLVFSRQFLPNATMRNAPSISAWSQLLLGSLIDSLPEGSPWQLQIMPHYGTGEAGTNRCRLIGKSLRELLQRKRRTLLRNLKVEPARFTPEHSVVQLLLLAPDRGLLSVAICPQPFNFRRLLSPFPKGEIAPASDKAAPSRAFAKLLEAEQRLGFGIAPGESCADLGASPGSWSYVALNRGAHVIAVDRAPLRADLMGHPRLVFHKGDAFKFQPEQPVDWLLCDVIASPDRSIELILKWLGNRSARKFVVTIKFKGREQYGILEELKHALSELCAEFFLMRLCANKNEVCAFGTTELCG